MNVSVSVDMRNFNRGFNLAMEYTSRAPALACNFAGKEVAFGTFNNTPVTTPQRVDTELLVIKNSVQAIGKRGKPIKKIVTTYNSTGAMNLVNLRAWAGSKYNIQTNQRYFIPGNPFKGLKVEARERALAAYADAMIKSRHRSANGFIRAGWLNSIKTLKALVPSRYGGLAKMESGQNIEALGSVQPAQSGQSNATCVIENDVGLEGQNAESHNKALQQIGGPALQRALDNEGRKQMEYFLKKSGREDLEIPVNRAWGP